MFEQVTVYETFNLYSLQKGGWFVWNFPVVILVRVELRDDMSDGWKSNVSL